MTTVWLCRWWLDRHDDTMIVSMVISWRRGDCVEQNVTTTRLSPWWWLAMRFCSMMIWWRRCYWILVMNYLPKWRTSVTPRSASWLCRWLKCASCVSAHALHNLWGWDCVECRCAPDFESASSVVTVFDLGSTDLATLARSHWRYVAIIVVNTILGVMLGSAWACNEKRSQWRFVGMLTLCRHNALLPRRGLHHHDVLLLFFVIILYSSCL